MNGAKPLPSCLCTVGTELVWMLAYLISSLELWSSLLCSSLSHVSVSSAVPCHYAELQPAITAERLSNRRSTSRDAELLIVSVSTEDSSNWKNGVPVVFVSKWRCAVNVGSREFHHNSPSITWPPAETRLFLSFSIEIRRKNNAATHAFFLMTF